ncbi:MAG: hypothetical protein JXR95_09750 [Deltaproteobacteria bacterium]|nr:hypothetical protein [Deltaproteobacteria bacterium]
MKVMRKTHLPDGVSKVLRKSIIRLKIARFSKLALPFWAVEISGVIIFKYLEIREHISPDLAFLAYAVLGVMGVIFFGSFLFPVKKRFAASEIDKVAGGNTVLPAAVAFQEDGIDSPFAELTIEQAEKELNEKSVKSAGKIVFPRESFYIPFLIIFLLFLPAYVSKPVYLYNSFENIELFSNIAIRPDFNTNDPQFAILKDELKELVRKVTLSGNKNTEKIIRELQKIVNDLEKGTLTPLQAVKKLEAIGKKLEKESKDEILEEKELAWEELAKQLLRERDLKKLAEAVLKKDPMEISREMKELEKKISGMSDSQRKRHEKKLDDAVKKAAENLMKKAKDFQKKEVAKSKAGKKDEAAKLRKKAQMHKRAAESVKNLLKNDTEKQKYMRQRMEQAKKSGNKSLEKQAKKYLEKIMKDSQAQNRHSKGQKGNKGQQGNKGQKGNKGQQGNKGQKGNKGQQGKSTKKVGNSKSGNMGKSLDRYARSRRENNQSKQAKMSAEEIREAMRRLRNQGSGGNSSKGIKDFFDRAKGNPRSGGNSGGKAGKGGKGGQGKGYKTSKGAGKGSGNGNKKGPGKGGGKGGKGWGSGNGGKLMGKETRLEKTVKDKKLSSKRHSKGPSRNDVILGASEKGFSKQSYKKIFIKYKENAKEVLKNEKIPPGYKHLIKVYYRLIRPRE